MHNARGGRVLNDDAALAAWSVDAIRVVRDQLYRARNVSNQPLPFVQNWMRYVFRKIFMHSSKLVRVEKKHLGPFVTSCLI